MSLSSVYNHVWHFIFQFSSSLVNSGSFIQWGPRSALEASKRGNKRLPGRRHALTVGPKGHHLLDLAAPVEFLLLLQGHLHGPVQDGSLHHLAEGLREVVHSDHLQRVSVHAAQVVHEAATGAGLHHVVRDTLADLHRFQQVGDEQELGEEVLALRHGGQEWGTGSGRWEHWPPPNLVTMWEPGWGGHSVMTV